MAYGLQLRGKVDMGDIVCSISPDAGETWGPRITVFDHRDRNGTVQYAYNTNRGRIYVYNDRADRRGLFYKSRSVGGPWSEARTFYDHDNRNSYPTLIEDKPGQWLAVWDSSNHPDQRRTAIGFGRLVVGVMMGSPSCLSGS